MDWSKSDWLLDFISKDFTNEIVSYTLVSPPSNSNDLPQFECEIRSSFNSSEEAMLWKAAFEESTSVNYIYHDARKESKFISVSKDLICHRSNRKKVVKTGDDRWTADQDHTVFKSTDCKAGISLRVKKPTPTTRDPYTIKQLFGQAKIRFVHNHKINFCAPLKFLKPAASVKQQVLSQMDDGLRPSQIIRELQSDLLHNEGELASASGQKNPKNSTVYTWHRRRRLEEFGGTDTDQKFFEKLEEKKKKYADKGVRLEYCMDPVAYVVVTPMMARASSLPYAKETLFMDSTSTCDSSNKSVTLLLAALPFGAFPVGLMFTNQQTTAAYTAGLQLFMKIMGESAFGGQGFPTIVMRDKSAAEEAALNAVWPESKQLLCQFHVLSAVWKWLRDAKNGIKDEDRKPLMMQFREINYAQSPDRTEQLYALLYESETAQKYPEFLKYLANWWAIKDAWCFSSRVIAELRGHHTNNFSETTMRILKEYILLRLKQYNGIALMECIIEHFDVYYKLRLNKFAHGRDTKHARLFGSLKSRANYLCQAEISEMSPNLFEVPSSANSTVLYQVDTGIGWCSCHEGMFGGFCKHQMGVMLVHSRTLPNMPPITGNHRHMAAVLAHGEEAQNPEFYFGEHETVGHATVPLPTANFAEAVPMELNDSITEDQEFEGVSGLDEQEERIAVMDQQVDKMSNLLKSMIREDPTAAMEKQVSNLLQKFAIGSKARCDKSSYIANMLTGRGKKYKEGAKIPLQPHAASRRVKLCTQGSSVPSCVRLRNSQVYVPPKSARALGKAITNNRANAKSHGRGH